MPKYPYEVNGGRVVDAEGNQVTIPECAGPVPLEHIAFLLNAAVEDDRADRKSNE